MKKFKIALILSILPFFMLLPVLVVVGIENEGFNRYVLGQLNTGFIFWTSVLSFISVFAIFIIGITLPNSMVNKEEVYKAKEESWGKQKQYQLAINKLLKAVDKLETDDKN